MKIGIAGAGNVGAALGARWARNGHQITFTSRNPQSQQVKDVVARTGTNARAVDAGSLVEVSDVILLAVPWPSAEDAVKSLGDVHGKVLIDAMNPLTADLRGLAIGTTTSAGEKVAGWAKNAKVVKAFNTVGAGIMADTAFGGGRPVLFYCGDDAGAKKTVHGLAAELGFDAQDAGPLTQARMLEPFAMLWISLALAEGYGPDFAFQLLRR